MPAPASATTCATSSTPLSAFLKRLGVKVVLGERLTECLAGNSFEKRALRQAPGRRGGAVTRKTQTIVSRASLKVEIVGSMLPLNPNDGVAELPVKGGVVMDSLITKSIKSKDCSTSPA
ncbi:hypothetical protein V7S43_015311 [Phytophthora oleae]|uniref:Uncharacterized protein n=1 Tax=Phytophthora oleae TaxID=2107226 RepID=A0ABD3F1Y5_9STRA